MCCVFLREGQEAQTYERQGSEKTDVLCLKMAVTSPGAGVEAKGTLHSEPLQRSQALASISTTEYILFTSPSLEHFFWSTDFFSNFLVIDGVWTWDLMNVREALYHKPIPLTLVVSTQWTGWNVEGRHCVSSLCLSRRLREAHILHGCILKSVSQTHQWLTFIYSILLLWSTFPVRNLKARLQ